MLHLYFYFLTSAGDLDAATERNRTVGTATVTGSTTFVAHEGERAWRTTLEHPDDPFFTQGLLKWNDNPIYSLTSR